MFIQILARFNIIKKTEDGVLALVAALLEYLFERLFGFEGCMDFVVGFDVGEGV